MLEARRAEQKTVLEEGAALVKPGGRLAYVTCSVLPSENRDQVDFFLAGHPDFKLIPWSELWQRSLPSETPVPSADGSGETLLMTPRDHGTDGFFVAVMQRSE
jgi:16S rRNA (cytosine967-C5)-methyltransferase